MNKHVLVTSQFLSPDDAIDRKLRQAGYEVTHAPLVGTRTEDELVALLAGVHGVVAGSDPFTAKVLRSALDLQVVARTGVGYDSIDVDAATSSGIAVCNAPGINRQSVAEHTFALMLAHSRRLPEALSSTRNGGWSRPAGTELAGKTLGVIGLGAIGTTVAQIAGAFGMRIIGHDPFLPNDQSAKLGIELLDLDSVAAQADFLSIHLALSQQTYGLINASLLTKMRPTAVIINTARGPIIDEDALLAALLDGRIRGAALDVVASEPLPEDHPFRTLNNVVLTAHIGGSTDEARSRSAEIASDSVISALQGIRPATLINTDVRLGSQQGLKFE